MRLLRETNAKPLIDDLEVARTFWSRTRGLLGRSHLPAGKGLWILRCNSIHTFFMKFPIDLIFLNRKMEVTRVYRGVGPWRLIWPVFSASSVIELSEGFLERENVQVGERLHVDPAVS